MAQRKTLTEKQVDVLRWIQDGCPDGVMPDEFHRISAAALRTRELVTTSGHGPTWEAAITSAGREYLEQVDSSDPPIARQPNVSVTQQLVDDVIAAGGSLRVPRHRWNDPDRIDYARRVQIAQRLGKVPDGKRLEVIWHDTELEIRLEEASHMVTVELAPIAVPERIGRYHRAAREFRDRSERHEISREQLARATRIVHTIATEAETRGWEVSVPDEAMSKYGNRGWTGTKYGHIQIEADGEHFWLRVQEEGARTRGSWEEEVHRYRHVRGDESWWSKRPVPRGAYDADATGRLQLTLHTDRYWALPGRQSLFADRRSWTLETRLPHLFKELEERILELQAYDEAKRVEAERKAEAARRAAEEREREWHRLMALARERLLADHLAAVARRQSEAWRTARDLRQYCDAIEAADSSGSASAEWVNWMRDYATGVDPLGRELRMPVAPEEAKELLQKYLPAGWSSEGPEHRSASR